MLSFNRLSLNHPSFNRPVGSILRGVLFCFLFLLPFFSIPTLGALELDGVYFTETGCNHCDIFLYKEKPQLESTYSVKLNLTTYDILSTEGYERCVKMLADRGLTFTVFPVLFIGHNVYRGNGAIESNLSAELEYYLAHGTWRPTVAESKVPTGSAFVASAATVLLAGLLDGINPCAFSTMLFFLSFMALRHKNKMSLLFVALAFILTVFATYFIIGLGLLSALRTFFSAQRFSVYLDILVSLVAVVFAILNIRDGVLASHGKVEDSVLQLPSSFKRLGHGLIRHFDFLPLYILGAALSGFLVSFIELACTGQIYLPTLAYMNQSAFSSRSLILLTIYNLAFVFPLTLVFLLFFLGLRHETIRRWYGQRMVLVRILSAIFFLALGTLVWIL